MSSHREESLLLIYSYLKLIVMTLGIKILKDVGLPISGIFLLSYFS